MTPKGLLTYVLASITPVLGPSWIEAAETVQAEAASMPSGGEGETIALLLAIGKVVGSLAIVVGLMLLAVHLVKKIGIGRGAGRDGRMINVLDTRMIAPKKYVAVVRIAGQCVALGITDQHISLLTKVEDYCPAQDEELAGRGTPAGGQPFAASLKRATGLLGKKEKQEMAGNQ